MVVPFIVSAKELGFVGVFGHETSRDILIVSLNEELLDDVLFKVSSVGMVGDILLEVSGVTVSMTQKSMWLIGGKTPVYSYSSIQDGLSYLKLCCDMGCSSSKIAAG